MTPLAKSYIQQTKRLSAESKKADGEPKTSRQTRFGSAATGVSTLAVLALPFSSSLNHTLTIVFECFLWWMSHRDNVWTLCWELLSSDSFFSKATSEKADISTGFGGGEAASRFSRC